MTRPTGWKEEAGQRAAGVESVLRARLGLTEDGAAYVLKYARHRLDLVPTDPLVPAKFNRPTVELLRQHVARELGVEYVDVPTAGDRMRANGIRPRGT